MSELAVNQGITEEFKNIFFLDKPSALIAYRTKF